MTNHLDKMDPFFKGASVFTLCCAFSLASASYIWDTDLARQASQGWGRGITADVGGFVFIMFGAVISAFLPVLVIALIWGGLIAPLRDSWQARDWPDFCGYFLATFFIFNSFAYALGPGGYAVADIFFASWLIVILSAGAGYGVGSLVALAFRKLLKLLG